MTTTADPPEPMPYRGEDRRLASLPSASPRGPFLGGLALLAAVWVASVLLGGAGEGVAPVSAALSTAVSALALVLGTLCLARWLVAGETPALLLGAGSLCYGVAAVGVVELFPLLGAWPDGVVDLIARIRPAALLVVLALFGAGALVRRIDTRVSGTTVLLCTLAALGLLSALAPWLHAAGAQLPSVMLVGSAVLAVLHGVRGWRRLDWLSASFALLLTAVALAEVTGTLVAGMPAPGAQVLRLLGLGCALYGALRQLLLGYQDQSASLLRTRVSLATAQDRVRASRERAEELAHESRSALAAIEGAAITLERYHDRLPDETRAHLTTAVKGEIRRLQRLVSPTTEDSSVFDLSELLAPIVAAEHSRGTVITSSIPRGLRAEGLCEATGDAVRTLLDNARRYAPGPVVLRAAREADRVVLRVEDRGPGVRPDQRGAIFARGTRGEAAEGIAGSGLGLYLAAEALQECGGQLWVDDRPGGGASFALSLPAPSSGMGSEVQPDEVEHRNGRVEQHPAALRPARHRPQAPIGGPGQAHHDRRRDTLG